MIVLNPEFHRHLWLKFSIFRLIAMPVIVGIVLFSFSNLSLINWQQSLFLPSLLMYFIVSFLWGNYEAASASNREAGRNTWDFQKMSPIGPWELVIGKLLGSTSYTWYFGAILLAIIAFSYGYVEDFKAAFADYDGIFSPRTNLVIYLFLSGAMGQASSFLFGMHSLKYQRKDVAFPFILGSVVSCTVLVMTVGTDLKKYVAHQTAQVNWHSLSVEQDMFIISSLLFFFFWTIIAIERNMRDELQFRNSPIVWMLFLGALAIYFSGFVDMVAAGKISHDKILALKLCVSFLLVTFFTYFVIFMEAASLAKYKRWASSIKNRQWKRSFVDTPAWFASLILIIPLYVLSNLMVTMITGNVNELLPPGVYYFSFTTSLLLLIARDGMAFHAILLGRFEKHKSFLLMFYFLMMYVLIPFLVFSVLKNLYQQGIFERAQYEDFVQQTLMAFFPLGAKSFFDACSLLLIQVLIAGLALNRVVKSFKENGPDKATLAADSLTA